MNWSHKIILAFILFGAMIFTMVSISMNQDLNLVDGDYYNQELEYQGQIERINNYQSLMIKPVFSYVPSEKKCFLSFPDQLPLENFTGTVHFFRPSNASFDKKYIMNDVLTREFSFDVSSMVSGLWTVKIKWNSEGNEYYFEENVTLL